MTSSSDFDEVIDRRPTSSFKWDKYAGKDILPLWVADMDFRSPPAVIDALKERAAHGIFGYTHPPPALNREVVQMLADRYEWRVDERSIVWLPGLVTGLNVSCRAFGKSGDEVLTATPVYPPFLTAPGFSDRKLVTVPLAKNRDRWEFDFDRLEKAFTDRTCLLILCNPHNPVGRIFTHRELEQLAAMCRRHDVILCSDEIHCDLILDKEKHHIPAATLGSEIAERTITLMAPSKTYNLPGLGCSYAVIPDRQTRQRFIRAMSGIVPHVNAMGYAAALAAYRSGQHWLAALLEYLRGNRERVLQEVRQMPHVSVSPVEATYLAWIDCRQIKVDNPARYFERAGIGLSDGQEFGGPGYVRLNFGCPRTTLDEALERMKTALQALD
jgi:cystathionine beta-lyase